jgi:transcriptional regulator with XRE-family HTH domain
VARRSSHPLLRTIGHAIRALRRERGLSQESLAGLAHIDRSYMSSIERGLRNVSVLNIARIAEALEVPTRDLLGPREVRPPRPRTTAMGHALGFAPPVPGPPQPSAVAVLPVLPALDEESGAEWEPGRYLSLG